jgi:hypothetical protein
MKTEVIVGAIVAGVVCGLVPLIVGLTRGEKGLAWGGFVSCIIGGFVLGLIAAVPLAIIFTVLIVKNSKVQRARDQQAAYYGTPQVPAQR